MKCPRCQMNISDTAICCLHCGLQFNNKSQNNLVPQNNVVQNNQAPVTGGTYGYGISQTPVVQTTTSTSMVNSNYAQNVVKSIPNNPVQVPKNSIVSLILSIINMVIIFPGVMTFAVLWLLFGAFSGDASLYYFLLAICGIYALVSIIWFFRAIWNVVKYSEIAKKIFIAIIIGTIVLSVGGYCYRRFFPNSARKTDNYIETLNKGSTYKVVNDTLYEDNDILIKVEHVYYNSKRIEVDFRLNNKSNYYYNFHINKVKLNDVDTYWGTKSSSHLSVVSWVEPGGTSDDYVMYLNSYDLKQKNLSVYSAHKISIQLVIYSDDEEGWGDGQKITDKYYDIELK